MDQLLVQNQQLKELLGFLVRLNQLLVKYREQVQEMTANCTCRGCELTEPLEEQYQAVMEEAGQIEMTAFKELMILPISCFLKQKINEEQIVDVSFQNDECSKRLGSVEINEPDNGEEASRSNVMKRNLRKQPAKVDCAQENVKKMGECNQPVKRRGRPRKVKLNQDERKMVDQIPKKSDEKNVNTIKKQQKKINKNRNKCDVPGCDFVGRRRHLLEHHKRVKHDGELIKCDECEKTFRSKPGFKEHKMNFHSDKKWRCQHPDCGKSFGNFKYFQIHQLRHTDFKPFACTWPDCKYRALQKGNIQVHIKSFHSDERPFTCTFVGCDKKFKNIYTLKSHQMLVHEDIRMFKCSWPGCDNEYKNKKSLTKHQLNHSGLKPAVCNWPGCEFRAAMNGQIRKHIRYVHERIRKNPCTWPGCDKKFFDKQTLKEHVNTHTGHKPIKCLDPDCSWTFILRGNMMKHYRNIHEKKAKS